VKVGFFSPLPPAPTGVADYSAALVAALRRSGPVEVGAADADVCLYHLGNNLLHRDIYRRALARPGVAVLHDAVLHHFFLGTLDEPAYTTEFVHNYGPWSADLARGLWRGRARSAADPRYFEYPMLRRIAETSKALLVHNPEARAMVLAHAPSARVSVVPHLYEDRPAPPGYRLAPVLFGVFGHLRESKRLFAILKAFRAVPGAALLVAGRIDSAPLARALEPFLAQPGVIRRPFQPEPEFSRLLASVDVGISLRHPSAGETSGILIRLMGLGKPVLVTRGAGTSGFPEDVCVRVDSGPAEVDMLADMMRWLAADVRARLVLGRRARAYILERHSPERAARLYWEVLRSSAG
jgi:glycosyltransferase involved in cell wall biosynthesis